MGQRDEIIAREELLKKIRNALLVPKENPYEDEDLSADVFVKSDDLPEVTFAQQLSKAGGMFVFCENVDDFFTQFHNLREQKNWSRFRAGSPSVIDFLGLTKDMIVDSDQCNGEEVSITRCDFLAARTGSVVISSAACPDRLAWSFCSVHIVVATSDQVVEGLTKAYALIKDKYKDNYPSIVSVVSGPSRTADIEKQIVMGAHGPVEVYVFLIDQK